MSLPNNDSPGEIMTDADILRTKQESWPTIASWAYWLFVSLWFSGAAVRIFFTPLAGDESYYFYFSQLMKHGGQFFDKYWLEDKPGGLQFFYYIITPFRNGFYNFYSIRVFTIIYQLITIGVFYSLCKRVFRVRRNAARMLLPIFILVYLNPVVEGQFSNADNFVVLWILLAAHLFLSNMHMRTALVIGISFCIKQNTSLEVMPSSLAIMAKEFSAGTATALVRFIRSFRIPLMQLVVFFLPITFLFLYSEFNGTGSNFMEHAFLNRMRSHIMYKNYDFATRYGIPILSQTLILWVGTLGYFLAFVARLLNPKWRYPTEQFSFKLYTFLWLIFSVTSVWVGGYFFPHYFVEIVPLLVIASTMFFLEVGAVGFYSVLVTFLWISSAGAGLWLIIPIGIVASGYVFEKGIRIPSDVVRPALILASLLFTLKENPWTSVSRLIGSQDRYQYYSENDRNIYDAADFLRVSGAKNPFVYDHTMEIYCLAGMISEFRYGPKYQYVNYSELLKENLNYPNNSQELNKRRSELLRLLDSGVFDYVVVNHGVVRKEEGPEFVPILKGMHKYSFLKKFGQVWVYSKSGTRKFEERKCKIEKAILDKASDQILISINQPAFVPEIRVTLSCEGGLVWQYPENGIIFPMKTVQDADLIEVSASSRGFAGGECSLVLENVFGERRLDGIVIKSKR